MFWKLEEMVSFYIRIISLSSEQGHYGNNVGVGTFTEPLNSSTLHSVLSKFGSLDIHASI